MTLLASDLINPAFVGAKDPDSLLAVEFYWGSVKRMGGAPALDKDGQPRKIPYVRISVPGNETFMVDVPVREEHKRRFARQWQYWQIQESQGEMSTDFPGWKIEEWTELTKEQVHELKFLRFSVVEQIANASDMQVQRMGPDGMALRMKARDALTKRTRELYAKEIEGRDQTIKDLQEGQRRLQEQVERLIAGTTAAKPERPGKEK